MCDSWINFRLTLSSQYTITELFPIWLAAHVWFLSYDTRRLDFLQKRASVQLWGQPHMWMSWFDSLSLSLTISNHICCLQSWIVTIPLGWHWRNRWQREWKQQTDETGANWQETEEFQQWRQLRRGQHGFERGKLWTLIPWWSWCYL